MKKIPILTAEDIENHNQQHEHGGEGDAVPQLASAVQSDVDTDTDSVISLPVTIPITLTRRREQRSRCAPNTRQPLHPGRYPKGAKKRNRLNNALSLLSQIDEEELGDVGIDDFMTDAASPLSRLHQEEHDMKVWSEFISLAEEDQQAILDGVAEDCVMEEEQEDEEFEILEDTKEDGRHHHPAAGPSDAFNAIDANLKTLLKQRNLPIGMLEHLECDVTTFFTIDPRGVYISSLLNSFERCLLHALCQYHALLSKSFDSDGERRTKVENPHCDFWDPPLTLSAFLEQHTNIQQTAS